MLTFRPIGAGIEEGRLDLALLYPDDQRRRQFEQRWPRFLAANALHRQLFHREGQVLVFRTESFIPSASDGRPPLLLLLGNPAAHSVLQGLCFASEGDNREHRFWVALRDTGLLRFDSDASSSQMPLEDRNRIRKEEFYRLAYSSPFRIGITVYFSLPSEPSQPPWAGVQGLRRLFGQKAVRDLELWEQARIRRIFRDFMRVGGGVIAFQSDAYEGVCSPGSPAYDLKFAFRGALDTRCKFDLRLRLLGAPPTRYLYSRAARDALSGFRSRLLERSRPPPARDARGDSQDDIRLAPG